MRKKSIVQTLLLSSILSVCMLVTAGCSNSQKPAPSAGSQQAQQSKQQSSAPGAKESNWPTKPISVIIPASPGGGTDVGGRLVGKYLSQELGQPVVIKNISGAGGSIGTKEAANSAPDGYNMLYIHEDIITNNVLGTTTISYRDFELVGKIFNIDTVGIIANPKYKTLDDVVKAAKANPQKVTFAIDIGTSAHLVPLLMQDQLGIEFNLVDGGSANDRLPLLVSGQLDLTFMPLGIVKDYISTGKLNCVGILSPQRSSILPNMPTFKEQGADITVDKFFNFYFPKGTPQEHVTKFQQAMEKVSKNPEFIKEAESLYYKVNYANTQDALPALKAGEEKMNKYKELIIKTSKKK